MRPKQGTAGLGPTGPGRASQQPRYVEALLGVLPDASRLSGCPNHRGLRFLPHVAFFLISEDRCDVSLLLTDDSVVYIAAKQDHGTGPADYCSMAEVAMNYAANVLAENGTVPRRKRLFVDESLANRKACDLLNTPALTAVPGVDPADSKSRFADWSCANSIGNTQLILAFERNEPLAAELNKAQLLGGRQVVIKPADDGPGSCIAYVVNREYEVDDLPIVEAAKLMIYAQHQDTKRLCDQVTELAEAAAVKLG